MKAKPKERIPRDQLNKGLEVGRGWGFVGALFRLKLLNHKYSEVNVFILYFILFLFEG